MKSANPTSQELSETAPGNRISALRGILKSMIRHYAFCAILLAQPALGQWKRYVQMNHGTWTDSPSTHGIGYFKVYPCARSDPRDRLLQCGLNPSKESLEEGLKMRTNLAVVGKAGGLTVYDLEYFFSEDDRAGMRSILVGRNLRELHEIHVQENPTALGILFPSEILTVGRQSVLKTKMDDGGMYHIVAEDYFVVADSGVNQLSFVPVFREAERAVPVGEVIYQPTERYDFDALLFTVSTERRDAGVGQKVACCIGRVEVPFRLERDRVVPGHARYFPE